MTNLFFTPQLYSYIIGFQKHCGDINIMSMKYLLRVRAVLIAASFVSSLALSEKSVSENQEVKSETIKEEEKPDALQQEDKKNDLISTFRFIKSSNDAISASRRLKYYVKEIADSFFQDHGKAFRENASFFKSYMTETLSSEKEIARLQSSDVTELKEETAVLIQDLELFLASSKIKQTTHDFLEQNKKILAHMDRARSSSTPFIVSFFNNLSGSNEQMSDKAAQIFKKFREYIEKAAADEEDALSEKARKSAYASMYLIASIFNNNGTKIAYLYDNETVIESMGAYISKQYGENPLLTFALELAPFIDVVNREFGFNWSTTRALFAQYQSLVYTAVGVGGLLLFAFCYNKLPMVSKTT